MRFSLKLALLAALAGGLAYLGSPAAAQEEKVKPENIKGCMAFQNKVRKDIGAQAKKGNWESIQKQTEEWMSVAKTLGSQKPPKGDERSWKELTDKYAATVKSIDDAADKKDAAAVTKGLAAIGAMCQGCHGKHRPK
jgi:cytochrome c556